MNVNGYEIAPRANLEGANLEGANLRWANLFRANLEGANLFRANLFRANLEGANLFRANLFRANLEGADLRGADLRWADLRWANLFRANLEGANLSKVLGAIDLGTDPRGYRFVGIRHDDGWRVAAGCRWFTIPEAVAHWTAKGNLDALARVAILEAHK